MLHSLQSAPDTRPSVHGLQPRRDATRILYSSPMRRAQASAAAASRMCGDCWKRWTLAMFYRLGLRGRALALSGSSRSGSSSCWRPPLRAARRRGALAGRLLQPGYGVAAGDRRLAAGPAYQLHQRAGDLLQQDADRRRSALRRRGRRRRGEAAGLAPRSRAIVPFTVSPAQVSRDRHAAYTARLPQAQRRQRAARCCPSCDRTLCQQPRDLR